MNSSRDSMHADQPPGWAAWLISIAIHAGLFALMFYLLRTPTVQGAAKESSREVGIALKRMTDDGPQFDDEDRHPTTREEDSSESTVNDPRLAVLPAPAELPSSGTKLPHLSTLGPNKLTRESVGDVGQMATGSAPSKRLANQATVRVFGISGTGTRFVYVFDRSISMAGPPLRVAKQQLIASLDSLDSVHQFQIIFFNHEPQAWDLTGGQNRIAFATDANKRLAEKFVRSVSATGGTFRRTALQLALRLRPDVIFFLSDTDDPMAKDDLAEAIRRAKLDMISINTIEYGTGESTEDENFLVNLARDTGGRYVYVDTQRLGR